MRIVALFFSSKIEEGVVGVIRAFGFAFVEINHVEYVAVLVCVMFGRSGKVGSGSALFDGVAMIRMWSIERG